MEVGPVVEVFRRPRHAYTLGLLGSIPSGGVLRRPLRSIEGTPPSLADLPRGCAFAPRCAFVTDPCRAHPPDLVRVGPDHVSACLHHDQVEKAAS
jgi:peptide/nickel transport system ATP-binding protein/oligopeptide transport system ATP-binding protein